MNRSPDSLALLEKDIHDVYSLLPAVRPGNIYLIVGQSLPIWPVVQELAHNFAVRGELRVVVGGNHFSLERLPLLLGAQMDQLYDVMDRVWVTRGETCYQLLDALQKTPNSRMPLIVMDILNTLYDEDLTEVEVKRVLSDCVAHLRRLSATAPVLVSASGNPNRPHLLESLLELADHSIELRPASPVEKDSQGKLF